MTEKDHNEELEPAEGTEGGDDAVTTDAEADAEVSSDADAAPHDPSDDEVTGEVPAAPADDTDDAAAGAATDDGASDDSPSLVEEIAAAAGVSDASQGEIAEPVKFAHIIGYSTPDDEVSRPSTGDPLNRTDEELEAMGVESDALPMGVLLATGVGIIALLVLIFIGVGSLFGTVKRHQLYEEAWAGDDPRYTQLMAAESADLAEPAVIEVEDGPTEYRVPIEDAMRIVEANPRLLGGHPLGETPEPPEVPAAQTPPERTAPIRIHNTPAGAAPVAPGNRQLRLVAPDGAGPADTIRLVPAGDAVPHDHDGDGQPDH